MEVHFLNNVFTLGRHHHDNWSPLISIPILLNIRTNKKLSIIYSVTGSEHKNERAFMVSCRKRLPQLCFYPWISTSFLQTGDIFNLCPRLSYTKKTFSCKEIPRNCFMPMLKKLYFPRDSGMIEGFVCYVLNRLSSLRDNSTLVKVVKSTSVLPLYFSTRKTHQFCNRKMAPF